MIALFPQRRCVAAHVAGIKNGHTRIILLMEKRRRRKFPFILTPSVSRSNHRRSDKTVLSTTCIDGNFCFSFGSNFISTNVMILAFAMILTTVDVKIKIRPECLLKENKMVKPYICVPSRCTHYITRPYILD